MQQSIAFIGAGNMASAIIEGLINNGYAADRLYASDQHQPCLDKLKHQFGINIACDSNVNIPHADIVVLAVKPQQMAKACAQIKDSVQIRKPMIISIAAGITCDMLDSWLGNNLALIRCMPNTPALIRSAATGLFANSHASDEQRQQARQLLEAIGIVRCVDSEHLLDAVTAVSGSGPAYFFLLIEAMQAAGEKLGLDSETAKQLSLQTALGAAKMASASSDTPSELRRKVTSPHGTTEAAIQSFESQGFTAMVETALIAADTRSKTLAIEMAKGQSR